MIHFNVLILQKSGFDLDCIPGAGAAGGIAGSMHALLKAKLYPGIQIIFEAIQLSENIKQADLIITGEGRLDQQTINGKVVSGIIKEANRYDKPVWALCGQNTLTEKEVNNLGLQKVFTLLENASLEECLKNTENVVKKTILKLQKDLSQMKLNKN
jgi:glycerate kinase